MFGWLRRRRAGPDICRLRLQPINDITLVDDAPVSTGNDPYFLLEPPDRPALPTGRCEFAFDAAAGTVPLQPVLYLDTGAGFNEAQTIRLQGGEAGAYRQLLDLPPGLVRIRFDPTGLPGPIPITNARLIPRDGPVMPENLDRDDYPLWLRHYDQLRPDDLAEIAAHASRLPDRPLVHIHIGSGPADAVARTRASLNAQLYRRWRIGGSGWPMLRLRAGDVLAPHALYLIVQAPPGAQAVVTDEDRLDPPTGARTAPVFRSQPGPASSPEDYGAVLLRQPGDLPTLLATPGAVAHVPGLLLHRTSPVTTPVTSPLTSPLTSSGPRSLPRPVPARMAPPPNSAPTSPKVSVIIPSRDKPALLRRTLDGVLRRTAYAALEILVMDNGSTEPDTLAYHAELANEAPVRIIAWPGPFNYSALNNAGVAAASGDVIVLLNNDMDIIGPDWLAELVTWAVRPDVGAVGARLLYADGTIQHAGIVTGMTGLAGHPYRHAAPGAAPAQVRDVAAVTGACLAIRRALYLEIGGLDEAELAVSYNDVDLCLRLRAAGYRVVWTPSATLHHLESASRGLDTRPDNAARAQREHDALLRRWGAKLLQDPFYNPQLDLGDERVGLAWPPRTTRPWRTD